jgi:Tol biopolymer transport system component
MSAHYKAHAQITVAMIVLTLVSGCGVKPTETAALPTDTSPPTTGTPAPPMDTPVGEASPTVAPLPPPSGNGGGQIAFYSGRDGNSEIYVINTDGTDLLRLTTNSAGDMAPAWSPNGMQIAFTSNRDGNNEIYVMNADGSDQRRLTNNPAYESHPDWSPDGTRIAFVSERDGNREIYTMKADGTNPQRLTNNPAEDMRPDWSPDGTQVLFNSERDGNWEIYVIRADGGELRRLTDSRAWEIFPAWSPDGTQIAYRCSSAREPNGDVCIMGVDGDAERTLTRHTGNDENPIWSPDGAQIVFQSDRYADPQTANTDNYNFEILIMDADGGNVRRLTNNPAGDYWPTWRPVTTNVLMLSQAEGEVATLGSLEQVDDYPLYTMHYYGDYDRSRAAMGGGRAKLTFSTLTWACSLFAALGDADNMLYGRNFDWRYSPALLLFTDPPDGYASVSMVDIEYLVGADKTGTLTDLPLEDRRPLLDAPFWPFDGMNEHGLVIGMAAVPPGHVSPDPDKETIGSLGVMREVLDHARDTHEAVAILQSYNIDMGGGPPLHYLVADPSGRSVLIEFYQGETILIPNQDPWHQATNFLRSSTGESAVGECWRYDSIGERLMEVEGRLTTLDAMDILSEVSQESTQWSIVYGLSTGDVTVAMGQEYDSQHTFHLGLAGE